MSNTKEGASHKDATQGLYDMTAPKEHPPRGHIPEAEVRWLSEGSDVKIYPTAMEYEPFNTIEYISLSESEHITALAVAAARAEAFEEAANYLYTNDSSDSQHDLIEELANDLRNLSKAARIAPTNDLLNETNISSSARQGEKK